MLIKTKCVGTPNGPCSYNASGDNVHYRYAELDLCSPCEQEQRKAVLMAKQGKPLEMTLEICLYAEIALIDLQETNLGMQSCHSPKL